MTRVALYARYSSDQQSASSIDDQLRICREQAARESWQVVGAYKDAAISGSSVTLRPGIQELLQDARDRKFEAVLAEALDRISRDQADVATLYKHLQFAGVRVVTPAEGEISELHVGLKGTMNALFLKDLAKKTHRGLRGRVEKGKAGGGLCYGYNVVKRLDGNGEPVRGERIINVAEADIVRRVFRDFANGLSPQAIIEQLNGDGVPGPGGTLWSATTLRRHVKRGPGFLNNELYVGKLVWNRQRYIKDPCSGKRVSRINPASEWITTEVPDLRIVDDALWKAVKDRQQALALQFANAITATDKVLKAIRELVSIAEQGLGTQALTNQLLALEAQEDRIRAWLAEAPIGTPDILPNITEIYRRKVERLAEALRQPAERDEASDAIRGLIERVVLTPGTKRGEVAAMLHDEFGTILDWVERREGRSGPETATPRAVGTERAVTHSVVAGTRSRVCYNSGFGRRLAASNEVENAYQLAA